MITTGPDGALWFTLHKANTIGRSTVDGHITTFSLPTDNAGPVGIHAGHESIWFAEINAGQIGRISSTGVIDEFPLPDRASRPHAVVALPDGGCWASLWAGNAVVRLDREGQLIDEVEFSDADADEPHGLALADDGVLWVAMQSGVLLRLENDQGNVAIRREFIFHMQ